MTSRIYPLGSLVFYKYTVIFAHCQGKWLFPRHKARQTFETAGGHIELGETPLEGAARELREETGAEVFDIRPVFDYWAGDGDSGANGQVFYAEVDRLGELPAGFEMREVGRFDSLPEALTYPGITPLLFDEIVRLMGNGGLAAHFPSKNKE
ncbi:MAG: NUDIX domain-containing protein [Oscillospiraceae bacterium]|nr:NUDIX domain-containing protein [Oscillospiraceae bacterium]